MTTGHCVAASVLERVLIVGLGSIGKRHARIARRLLPQARLTALRHGASSAADDQANSAVDDCVTTLEDALAMAPQLAVIASPAPFHLPVAMALARAGVPLLIEKPIAVTAHMVPELMALCAEAGTPLLVGYNLRFLPSLQAFRSFVQAGRIGRILSVRAEVGQYLPSWRPSADYRNAVSARSELGGGVLLELSHEIDYLRWILGDVEWVSATLRRQSALAIDVEDSAHLVLGFVSRDGAVPVVGSLNMDFVRHDAVRTCTVIGDAGSLRWTASTGRVECFGAGARAWEVLSELPSEPDDSYVAEWRDLLDCIATGREPVVGGADGLAALSVIAAARRSSEHGRVEVVA